MTDPAASAEDDRTLDRLESQSERTRADFIGTVSELQHRLSAGALKADAKRYVSRTGQGMLADLERKAQEHPLQTVALGAGLAYPVWRVLRHLPAPVLLLGAGVALAGRGGRDEASSRGQGLHAAGVAPARYGSPSEIPGQHTDEAGLGSTISSGIETATQRASEAAGDVAGAASRMASAASDIAASSYRGGLEATSHAGERAAAAGRAGREGLVDAVENHPLLVGGIGMLMGAAIAACLPSSRTERRLFGETSDRIKDQARASASHGLDAARAAGGRIAQNTMHEAEEQGLTAEDAEAAIRKVGSKAGAVADRAAKEIAPNDRPSSRKAGGNQDNS